MLGAFQIILRQNDNLLQSSSTQVQIKFDPKELMESFLMLLIKTSTPTSKYHSSK